jgi:hypothetical protein
MFGLALAQVDLQGDSRLMPGIAGHTFPVTVSLQGGDKPAGSYPPGRSRSADGAGCGVKDSATMKLPG